MTFNGLVQVVVLLLVIYASRNVFGEGIEQIKPGGVQTVSRSKAQIVNRSDAQIVHEQARTKEAYATMLYGNDPNFVQGVRVLGKSLRNSGTDRDMVVLCGVDVSSATKHILSDDGWIVKTVPSPGKHGPGFLNKLEAWKLIEYRRIVYIDGDAIVIQNVDELFRCGSLCAVFRASDNFFNAGIIVLKPSLETYKQLLSEIPLLDVVYQNDDQYLLNLYYRTLCYAHMFNASDGIYHEEPMRLYPGYNPEMLNYYYFGRWTFADPEKHLKIIHYTFGPVKPWRWWTYSVFDLNWRWADLRWSSTHDCAHNQKIWVWIVFILILAFIANRSLYHTYPLVKYYVLQRHFLTHRVASWIGQEEGRVGTLFPAFSFVFSHYFSSRLVLSSLHPHQAVWLCAAWILFFQTVFYTLYSLTCLGYARRRVRESSDGKSLVFQHCVMCHTSKMKWETVFWLCFFFIFGPLSLFYVPMNIHLIVFAKPWPASHRFLVFIASLILYFTSSCVVGRKLTWMWIRIHTQCTCMSFYRI